MRAFANLMQLIGALGLGLLLSRNLFDLIFDQEGAAPFFSPEWMGAYGVLYALSGSVLLLGVFLTLRGRRA